jgi:hypothetical protein
LVRAVTRRGAAPTCIALAAVVAGCVVGSSHAAADIGRANLDGSEVTPSFIATGSDPAGVAVDAEHIYWSRRPASRGDPGAVARANLDGSAVQPNFIAIPDPMYPAGVAVNSRHLYWANSRDGSIGRANLDGTGIKPSFIGPYVAGGDFPPAVAVGGGHVYWTSGFADRVCSGGIERANVDGSGVESFVDGVCGTTGLAVGGDRIYWSRFGAIGWANLDGSSADGPITTPGALNGVAVYRGHVYFSRRWAGAIGRARLDGSRINPNFITGARCVAGLAVGGGHLYWSNDGNCSDHELTVRIKSRRVFVGALEYGPASVKVVIPESEDSCWCSGTLRLRTAKKVGYQGERRRLVLGKAPLNLFGGTRSVQVHLPRSMIRIVRNRSRAHQVVARVRLSDQAGNQTRVAKRMGVRIER